MPGHVLSTTVLMAAVALATTPAASAGKHSTSTVGDYSWSDGGQSLSLHSQTGSAGVLVTHVSPEPFHGLRAGDRLLAADGKPLHQVEELTRLLRGRTRPLELRVQRGERLTAMVWSQADYRAFAQPAPPAPPPPPPAVPHR